MIGSARNKPPTLNELPLLLADVAAMRAFRARFPGTDEAWA